MLRILRVTYLKKYEQVLVVCKEQLKTIYEYQWALWATDNVTMEQFWNWAKNESNNGSNDMYLEHDKYSDFEKLIWSELGKSMQRKHRGTFQENVKYIHNVIVKTFRVRIIQYAEHVHTIHNLSKYLPPPFIKGREFEQTYWTVCDK